MPRKRNRPRVAFVGLGWIGRHRLDAVVRHDVVDIVALADADPNGSQQARVLAPEAAVVSTLEEALEFEPDGVVLATPSAMHAEQTIAALHRGAAVFCQKPLGRDASEVLGVIDTARQVNQLLAVDVSYRHTEGLSRVRELIREGAIGQVYAIDLTFHNGYGPDKPWFYDVTQSGGGCLLDLGVHLIDFLHWTFDAPATRVAGHLFAAGQPLSPDDMRVEDYAIGEIELANGAIARIACSWRLSAGCDAQIGVYAFGTEGGVGFRNVGGSFYDFVSECYRGTTTHVLTTPPEEWGGRAAVEWTRQLARSPVFDPGIEIAGRVAVTLDGLYGRSQAAAASGCMLTESTRRNLAPRPTLDT